MKVRVFPSMNNTQPQNPTFERLAPQPHRVMPKKVTWEEELARFEKRPSPPPVESDVSKGTTNSSTPR